ncbi:TIGR00725 family protein [candidate division WOR-3 bacterium]|nr:TIGR00725 family protein [candidate division WOR-3 bacterium]
MKSVQIGVIGGRYCNRKIAKVAEELGGLIAGLGWTLVCGGRGGVMEAACKGAAEAGGVTIGILPESRDDKANEYLTYVIRTGMGEGRNVIIVHSSDALVAVDGKYGTLSEIALAMARRKKVFGLGTWDIPGVEEVRTPKEAIARIKEVLDA